MQLLAVILVCASTISPADCTRDTALDVVTQPAALPMECIKAGELVGASALDVRREDRRYVMVRCERRKSS
ncbi:hypothetical protein [Methylobacterium sp. Leaf466]|uniref:hypothetical protein n=1 Tax=Methylobacterium sp. Leaf466 TaxID=1736386 RepID=UPI0006FDAB5D|nr:hypothetical protein [Methylobacterium sp. Leaf466]KQT88920.1 hypothetical protein ASG59_13700 [Methylobacterium sp. Leaf466]